MSVIEANDTEDRPVTLLIDLGDVVRRQPTGIEGVRSIRLLAGDASFGAILSDVHARLFIVRSQFSLIPAHPRTIERAAMVGDLSAVHAAGSVVERSLSGITGSHEPVPFSIEVGWARAIGALVAETTGSLPTAEVVSAARRAQVEYLVRCFSGDRRLTPDAIAAAIGVSRRTLYELAEPRFGGVSEYIRTTRALRASALLADPARATMSIGEIASAAGFSSTRHMARAVHALTGLSPNALRYQSVPDHDDGLASA